MGVGKQPNVVREREDRVMSLWRLGKYEQAEIARMVGISQPAVCKIIARVLERHTARSVDEGVALQMERLEAVVRSILPLATAEPQLIVDDDDETMTYIIPTKYQLESIDRLNKTLERMGKWKGWDAPTKTEATVDLNTSDPKTEALDLLDKLSTKKDEQ